MGLDTVEIVMEIEETFGIIVPDRDAEKIQTIGDAYRCIIAKLEFPEAPGTCLTSHAFYHFRRTLMRKLGTPRDAVRPEASMDKLLPMADQRDSWAKLGEWLGWRIPSLERPAWVGTVSSILGLTLLIISLSFGPLVVGFNQWAVFPSLVCALVVPLLTVVMIHKVTEPLAVHIPQQCATVHGLIKTVATKDYATIARQRGGWNRAEVREILFKLISEQMGVPREKLTEETSFVNDLGAD
jgi:acyl carrier protein